jgi:ribosomal protein S18 acetylase RimI-like enzyme
MARRGGVTIREYREADRDRVIALARELQAHEIPHYDRMKPADQMGSWYIDHLIADVEKHKGSFLVAETQTGLQGYATLLAEVSSEDEADEVLHTYAYVGDIVVSAKSRGQGIGQALIAECETLARKAGQRHLRLTVLAENAIARRFYLASGFKDQFVYLEKLL